jgi:hypothetical protein
VYGVLDYYAQPYFRIQMKDGVREGKFNLKTKKMRKIICIII